MKSNKILNHTVRQSSPCKRWSLFHIGSALIFVSLVICFSMELPASAVKYGADFTPPGVVPPEGQPPPIGDGSVPDPVTAGDTGQPQRPPSRTAQTDPVHGTYFAHEEAGVSPLVNLVLDEGDRGIRTVLTFRPGQLTGDQLSQIEGILGAGFNSGGAVSEITVSKETIEAIQNILFPYPKTTNSAVPFRGKNGGPRKFIESDQPADGYPKYQGDPRFDQYKPTFSNQLLTSVRQMGPREAIREFCRYLVILGVVCACLFMIFAAISLMFGNRNAGAQIIGAAGGLMLLLCAYSIWKVIMVNTWDARNPSPQGPDIEAVDLSLQQNPLPSRAYSGDTNKQKPPHNAADPSAANLPPVPAAVPGRPQRSGLPVAPLIGSP